MRRGRTLTALTLGVAAMLPTALAGSVGAATGAPALTQPQARAIVAAGVIKQDDLPKGFFTPPMTANDPDRKEEIAFYACLGRDVPAFLARNQGTKFLTADKVGQAGAWTLEVDSSADVTKSLAAAKDDQTALRTSKAVSCYRELLVAAISKNLGAEPKSVAVELVAAQVAGADEVWAYRLAWTVARDGEEISGNGYLVGSRVGRALLRVSYTGTGKDYTLTEVTELAAKPLARAKRATPRAAAKS